MSKLITLTKNRAANRCGEKIEENERKETKRKLSEGAL